MVKANAKKHTQNSHMEVSINVGVIVDRTQFFDMCFSTFETAKNNHS